MEHSRKTLTLKVLRVFNSRSHMAITKDMLNCNFKELKIDSIDLMQVIVMIEKLFHIPIFDDEIEKTENINDCIKLVERKINKGLYHSA